MDTKTIEAKLDNLKHSIETLILIELCKLRAKRGQARGVTGSLDNNSFSKINKILSSYNKKKQDGKKTR